MATVGKQIGVATGLNAVDKIVGLVAQIVFVPIDVGVAELGKRKKKKK